MKFNNLITHILESLTTKVHPTLDQEREAYTVAVMEPMEDDYSPQDPLTIKVGFEESNNGELWSQWWDFNHDVLYQGGNIEQAFKVFCDTYRRLVKVETSKWKRTSPEKLQECFDTVETNIKTTRQCIDTFKHIHGEWKVFDMGRYVDPLLVIGLEVDVKKYRVGGLIDAASNIAGDDTNNIIDW